MPLARVFRQSVLGNIMNPKVTLFFLVFLPQFVRADAAHPGLQFLLLGVVFMLQTAVVFSLFGLWRGLAGRLAAPPPGHRPLAGPRRRGDLRRSGDQGCAALSAVGWRAPGSSLRHALLVLPVARTPHPCRCRCRVTGA